MKQGTPGFAPDVNIFCLQDAPAFPSTSILKDAVMERQRPGLKCLFEGYL